MPADSRFASRRAAELALELGLAADELTGTGRDGAITVDDVRAAPPSGAPRGLGEPGRALFKAAHAPLPEGMELDEREEAIAELAARQADHLALLEDEIRRDGVTTTGSKGQPVVHPAVAEARQARLAIARLLGQLGLPQETNGTAASVRGQRAARARWEPVAPPTLWKVPG